MFIRFEKEYLEELYNTGKSTDKKHRFQPKVVDSFVKKVDILGDAPNAESLFRMNSLNYEVLSGDKKGISSIRIDRKYRLEFTVSSTEGEPVVTVCSIIDITNHYK